MSYYRKSILVPKVRVVFDPKNRKHMLDFARFVKYNNWNSGCEYYLEDPYTDIPTMIRHKIVDAVVASFAEKV